MASKEVEEGKVCAFLAYLFVGIIWYFADEKMKKNRFAKYHVKQGIGLLVLWLIVWVISWVIPWGLWFVVTLLNIALVVLMILGIINAVNGNEKELPVASIFAKMFTF